MTDNLEVAKVLNQAQSDNDLTLSSWLEIQEARDCLLWKRRIKDLAFVHLNRSLNVDTDYLANLARILRIAYMESTMPRF